MFRISTTDKVVSEPGNDGSPAFYGADRSALITDYVDPPAYPYSGGCLFWWRLYRDGDTVYVQNHILFFEQLSQPFSAECPWNSVRDRRVFNEDGQKVSEWPTTIEEIKYFLSER
jgi:hypothetical protein